MNIFSFYLIGPIPSLSGLTNLQTLDLTDNQLSGKNPNDFINIRYLYRRNFYININIYIYIYIYMSLLPSLPLLLFPPLPPLNLLVYLDVKNNEFIFHCMLRSLSQCWK